MENKILTHKKIGSIHNLYLDISTEKSNLLLETSFYAEAECLLGEKFKFNGIPMETIICPEVSNVFNNGDCVYCILDLANNKLVITDVHKSNFDSLIVFNSFSENQDENFIGSSSDVLFSTSITINDREKSYSDILLGCCVILENSMSEDGIAPLTMNIDIIIDGTTDFTYNIDCTRKHEIINFDHTLKNIKTNKNINIIVKYSYDNAKYGLSYVSPTIKSNNVTIYLEGSNILTSSADIFEYKIETDSYTGETYAVITNVIDPNLPVYRFPGVYIDDTDTSYLVKKVNISSYNCKLNNPKFISFANGIKYLELYSPTIYNGNYTYSLYSMTNAQAESELSDKGTVISFPDYGVTFINRNSTSNGGLFFNRENDYVIHGDPNDVLIIQNAFPILKCLPTGQYPTVTIDNFKAYYANGYNAYGAANVINLEGFFVHRIKYVSFDNASSSYPCGLYGLTLPMSERSISEPASLVTFNIKSKYCSLYNFIYYIYIFMHNCDINTAEKFHFYCDQDDVFFYIHHTTIKANIESDIILDSSYINYPLHYNTSNTSVWYSDMYCPVSLNNDSNASIRNNTISPSTYNIIASYNSYYKYTYVTIDGYIHTTLSNILLNINGNVYCYPSVDTSYIYNNEVNINGNLYTLPKGYNSKYIYSSSQFNGNSRDYAWLYYYGNAYDSCIVHGTYDLSKLFYKYMVRCVQRANWSYDDAGNSLSTSKYFTKTRIETFTKSPYSSNSLYSIFSNNYGYGIKKFHVDTLEGIVSIPRKYDGTMSTYYSIPLKNDEGESYSYCYLYVSPSCEFSFNEIKPGTMIINFNGQDLSKLNIDFSKLSGIGNLSYCNLQKLKLPTPIVAILSAPDPYYMSTCHHYKNSSTSYKYLYDDSEDFKWDPSWVDSNLYNSSVKYEVEIDFNAMVLGDIYLKYEDMTEEEKANDAYVQTIYMTNNKLKEKALEIEERLQKLSVEEQYTDSSTYTYYDIYDFKKPVIPKNSDIDNNIENFEFNYSSRFSFYCNYELTTATGEIKVFPKIKLFDVTRYIGSEFLNQSAYIMGVDPDVFELPKQLKWFGERTFNFKFVEVYLNSSNTYSSNTYYDTYGWATWTKEIRPLKEVVIGKYLTSMENNVFPFADKCTIDPENPNFVIENGFIFNKDKTVLYRPVCYSDFRKYADNDSEYIFKSSTLTKIVDRTSFVYDDKITGIEITSETFEIADLTNYTTNKQAILELPETCIRIILPSGLYTIRDEAFDRMEYIEFLSVSSTSKYYSIPGSEANDVYTNYSESITYYIPSIVNSSYNTNVNRQTFTRSGARMIFAKLNMTVSLPDTCTELGGRLNIDNLVITNTRNSQFNINSPNLKIHNYSVDKDNTKFYTSLDGEKQMLWYNTIVVNRNNDTTTLKNLLYKYPNGKDDDDIVIDLASDSLIDSNAFKYCNIRTITINSPDRATDVFAVAGKSGVRQFPVTVYNSYDNTTYYDDKNVYTKYQFAICNNNSYTTTSCYYKFANTFYYANSDHNILALPIRNDKIESLTIDFNPKYLFGVRYGSEGSMVAISSGKQDAFTSKYSNSVKTYIVYNAGTYIINNFIMPAIHKMYINYNFGTDLKCEFPILPLYDEVYFDESNLDTVTGISKLVVCNPDTKIYPESLLTKIDTVHNYELYYNTNTNLYLSKTEYTDCIFGEKCGAPFPSDSTITLDNCFIHGLFVHPSCRNLNLVINDNCRFGYVTNINTFAGIPSEDCKFNIYTQYADYTRTFNSANYTVGNEIGYTNRLFFLLSPSPILVNDYMTTLESMFTSITIPRLISFQYRGKLDINDKYKLGGLYKITQDILYIPDYCFDSTSLYTKSTENDVYTTGYDFFEYNQFKGILSTVKYIGNNNRFVIPVNTEGETVYELGSSFVKWEDCNCSNRQNYIDELIINTITIDDGTLWYNNFLGGTDLQYFIKKITFKNTKVEMYFHNYKGISIETERNTYYDETSSHIINITADYSIIDIGDIPFARRNTDSTSVIQGVASSRGQQTFEIQFTPSITKITIKQLQVPNLYSEELDFSKYPNISFMLGMTNPFNTKYPKAWSYNIIKISGFKKVVMSDNVSMYSTLPPCPFYYSYVETIEFKSGSLYSAYNCRYLTTIKFADTYTNIDQFYYGYKYINEYTLKNINLDNIQTITQPTNTTYSYGINYNFAYCDLSSSLLTSLQTVADNSGFYYCIFSETLSCPELLTAGQQSFYNSSGVQILDIPKCTSLGIKCFYMSTSITTVNAPLLESVGDYCFANNTSLTTINMSSLKTIGLRAFENTDITGVLTLENVETISDYAFNNVTELTEIHLPKCTSIGAYAFYSATKVTKAYIHPDCTITATSFYNSVEIDRTLYS